MNFPIAAYAVGFIGVVYICVALIQLFKGNIHGAVVWGGYGAANFGLMYDVK